MSGPWQLLPTSSRKAAGDGRMHVLLEVWQARQCLESLVVFLRRRYNKFYLTLLLPAYLVGVYHEL